MACDNAYFLPFGSWQSLFMLNLVCSLEERAVSFWPLSLYIKGSIWNVAPPPSGQYPKIQDPKCHYYMDIFKLLVKLYNKVQLWMHYITMSNKFMFAQVHEIILTDTTFLLVNVINVILFFKNLFDDGQELFYPHCGMSGKWNMDKTHLHGITLSVFF